MDNGVQKAHLLSGGRNGTVNEASKAKRVVVQSGVVGGGVLSGGQLNVDEAREWDVDVGAPEMDSLVKEEKEAPALADEGPAIVTASHLKRCYLNNVESQWNMFDPVCL